MIEKYPFFVYGTLIKGQPNDFYWQDCIESAEPAYFPNGRLFDMGSFPMLIENGGTRIKGQVMYPCQELSVESYQLLVQRLDTLENYDPDDVENSPYYRLLKTVFAKGSQPVIAWVYLGRPSYTIGRPTIPGGDWVSHSAEGQTSISTWWQDRGQDLLFGTNDRKTSGKD
jgi:gamma-glutamylcyclotransferase (GGCT)/AIG2-like uncharacterized protein YtfP